MEFEKSTKKKSEKKNKKKLVEQLYQGLKEMSWLYQIDKQNFFAEVKSSTYFASALMLIYGDDLIKQLNKDNRLEKLWQKRNRFSNN